MTTRARFAPALRSSGTDPPPLLPPPQLDRATQKSRQELKQLAKKNDVKSARIIAREIVRANKQRDRLISSKARVGSVQMQLQHQLCGYPGKGPWWSSFVFLC